MVVVIVVIKGVNKIFYYYLRHHNRAHRRVGNHRDLSIAKRIKIDLKRFKATLCLRGDDVKEPFLNLIYISI